MTYLGNSTFTGQTVADAVLHVFGDQAQVQLDNAKIITFINMGQREIIINNPVNKKTGSADTVGGQSSYDISTLKALDITSVRFKGRPLQFKTFQEAEEYIVSQDPEFNTQGDPILWYTWENKLNLYPVPQGTDSGALTIFYTQDFTQITNLSDMLAVPDRYFNALVQYVLSQAYEMDEDVQNSAFKMQQFDQSVAKLKATDNDSEDSDKYYNFITVLPEDDGW